MYPNYTDYQLVIRDSFQLLWQKIILYLPNVIVAVIVLIVGWVIGSVLGDLLRRLLDTIGIDKAANQLGMQRLSERTGRQFSISRLVQWVVKWFFFLASFVAAANILGLTQVTEFFYTQVLGYAGHVIIAMAIMLLGLLAANFFSGIVEGTVRAGGLASAKVLASITRWAIVTFTFIAVLSELNIASDFLRYLFLAIVAMLAIAGGIAFGLGGRDHARKILDHIQDGLGQRQ